jgi:DNA repair exonuclease SbcCD nuclease subunit
MADLHAQKRNLKELEFLFLKKIPEVAKKYAAKSLVIVGDVFHSVSQIETQVYVSIYNLLKSVHELGLDIRIIQGNHDIYMMDVSPLIPFTSVCKLYTAAEVEGPFEFLPYRHNMTWGMRKEPGVTFVHFTLNKILSTMNNSYSIPSLTPPSEERLYLAGHIHLPLQVENQVSLGCPIPFMFDEVAINGYIYILTGSQESNNWNLKSIPMNISSYQVVKVKTKEDLDNIKIKKGDVSTWVKIKIMGEAITTSDIMEFKKRNDVGILVTKESDTPQTQGRLDAKQASDPMRIYRQFLQQTETSHDKRKLYLLVVEAFKKNEVIDENSI